MGFHWTEERRQLICSVLLWTPAWPRQTRPAQPSNPLRQPSILKPIVAGHSDTEYFPEVWSLRTQHFIVRDTHFRGKRE